MKRLLLLVLLVTLSVGCLPVFAQAGNGAEVDQTASHPGKKRRHKRHKNHHKGHIYKDAYPR